MRRLVPSVAASVRIGLPEILNGPTFGVGLFAVRNAAGGSPPRAHGGALTPCFPPIDVRSALDDSTSVAIPVSHVGKSFSGRDGQPVRTRRSGAVAHANDADARWINGGGESRSSQPAFDASTNVGYILAVARVAPVRLGLEGKTMKKALMILGGIFVILVAFAILAIVVVAVKGNALDKESKQYADTAIRAVISQWDIGEIQSRASPEFKAAVKDDDLEKLGKMFRRLGNFKSYNGAKGQANMSDVKRVA